MSAARTERLTREPARRLTWRQGAFAAICHVVVAFMLLTPLAHACGSVQGMAMPEPMSACHEGHAMPGHAMPDRAILDGAMHGTPQSGPMWCCASDGGQAIPSAVTQLSKFSPAKVAPVITAAVFQSVITRDAANFEFASYRYRPAGIPPQLSVHVLLI